MAMHEGSRLNRRQIEQIQIATNFAALHSASTAGWIRADEQHVYWDEFEYADEQQFREAEQAWGEMVVEHVAGPDPEELEDGRFPDPDQQQHRRHCQ